MSLVQARERFVKLLFTAHHTMGEACRLCGISRKTGYKWKARFLKGGRGALRDQSRRPKHSANQTPTRWLKLIRLVRHRRQRWGARKIRARLRRTHPGPRVPAVRTIAAWLHRWKLTRRRPVRSIVGPCMIRLPLTVPTGSNHVWTVDFKGWFRTADGKRVEPLTVRDLFSRYILSIRLLPDQRWWRVRVVFVRLFARYGKPKVIRVDNGFGSTGPAGLSRLSAWWTALGIGVEFIQPGHPEQNGSHEQMHREYKAEVTQPASQWKRAQQRRSDRWAQAYNQVRPHEALGQQTPAERYRPGPGEGCPLVPVVSYPKGWEVRRVRSNGQIRWQGRLRFIGEAFVGLKVGLKPVGPHTRLVYLRRVVLGELRSDDGGGIRPAKYVRKPIQTNRKV